jgi:hypothetical protein
MTPFAEQRLSRMTHSSEKVVKDSRFKTKFYRLSPFDKTIHTVKSYELLCMQCPAKILKNILRYRFSLS